jgi:hypothetical protein
MVCSTASSAGDVLVDETLPFRQFDVLVQNWVGILLFRALDGHVLTFTFQGNPNAIAKPNKSECFVTSLGP